MRSLPASLRAILQQDSLAENDLDVLVEIDDPVAPLRRVLSTGRLVVWPPGGSDIYFPVAGAFSVLAGNLDGRRPQVTLTLQNVRNPEDETEVLPWSKWLQLNNPNGREVTFSFVATNTGDGLAQIIEGGWFISGVNEVTHHTIAFHVGSPHDALAAIVPRVSLAGNKCWATYREGFCTSASTLVTCNKSFAACRDRFGLRETLNFAPGFPLFTHARRRGVS